MNENLLDLWIEHLSNTKKGYWIRKDDARKYTDLLEKYFGREYFDIKPIKNSTVRYDHKNWLKFLLSNKQKNYTQAAIEFCQVLETFNGTQFEALYLTSKLKTKKGKIDENIFQGNYHELFTAFLFKVNGLEYLPDVKSDPTIYDGISRSFGKACLIECKELLSEDRVLKIHNLNFHITKELNEYWHQNVLIGKGNNRPLISGFIRLEKDINRVKEDFTLHLERFQHSDYKKVLKSKYKSGEICIEDFQEGLFQNYPFKKNEIGLKFKTDANGAEIKLTLPFNEILQIRRILTTIDKKRKQHSNASFPIKLISIGLTSYLFGRPFTIELLKENEKRIRGKLKDDTIAFFIIRNLINHKEYDIKTFTVCPPNLDYIRLKLNSLKLKFISTTQSKWIM